MQLKLDKLKKHLTKKVAEFEARFTDIEEKILNENIGDLHTMLVKSDYENFAKESINFTREDEYADLSDLLKYEKELYNSGGDKKR